MIEDEILVNRQNISFTGSHDNTIAGEILSPSHNANDKVALLVHGGGQTRHSWGGTALALANKGWTSIIFDQRGHGDSDWSRHGDYEFPIFADDLALIANSVYQQYGVRPVSIGASLGGIASMLAEGESPDAVLSALVLVDITPRMKLSGVEKIIGFMAENADSGFATLEEAADAIAAYLPHRPRPRSMRGLAKNLRKHKDGRYRWHWDPHFISRRENQSTLEWQKREQRLVKAAAAIKIPVLLVRGQQSELVAEEDVEAFLHLVPHAKFTDVSDAGHMIAGDKNDTFTSAVMEFLLSLDP